MFFHQLWGATPFFIIFFLSDVHSCPDDFEPQIFVSRDRSLTCLGDVTETLVFSFCARESEARRTVQDVLSGVSTDGGAEAEFFLSALRHVT